MIIEYFATERLKDYYRKVKTFLEQDIYPYESEWIHMPGKEVEQIIRKLKNKVQDTGCWNLYHSTEHQGPGLSLVEVAQMCELLGTTPFGHLAFNCHAPDAGNMELLLKYGNHPIHRQYADEILNGKIRSCFSMTEPHMAGSNPVRLGTTAVLKDGYYEINGHKWFTSSADGATFAIVMAITNPDAPNVYSRASMIVVPLHLEGVELIRNISVMGHAGEGLFSHAEIKYNQVRVPADYILGNEGQGFLLAQERLGPGRIHHCMRWMGIASRCFDMMCKRAVQRQWSEEKSLGDMQMVQSMIAESKAQMDATRLYILHTAYKMDRFGQKEVRKDISAIKFTASDMLMKVIDRAVQVHGALGITDDTLLSWYYREERGSRIYDGTDETHKASLAKQILKEYLA